jgi:hypothetical protein
MQRLLLAVTVCAAFLAGGCAGLKRPTHAAAVLPSPAETIAAWRPEKRSLLAKAKRPIISAVGNDSGRSPK